MSQLNVIFPKIGEDETETGTIQFFHNEGDRIVEDEDFAFGLTSENENFCIPSPCSGVISKILYKNGDRVSTGKTIAIIDSATS